MVSEVVAESSGGVVGGPASSVAPLARSLYSPHFTPQPTILIYGNRLVPRCQAASKRNPLEQCAQPAVSGTRLCWRHSGKLAQRAVGMRVQRSVYEKYLTKEDLKVFRRALEGIGNAEEIALLVTKISRHLESASGTLSHDQLHTFSQILTRLGSLREQDMRLQYPERGGGKSPVQIQVNVIWGERSEPPEVEVEGVET